MSDLKKAIRDSVNHIEWIKCTIGRYCGPHQLAERHLLAEQLEHAESMLAILCNAQRTPVGGKYH